MSAYSYPIGQPQRMIILTKRFHYCGKQGRCVNSLCHIATVCQILTLSLSVIMNFLFIVLVLFMGTFSLLYVPPQPSKWAYLFFLLLIKKIVKFYVKIMKSYWEMIRSSCFWSSGCINANCKGCEQRPSINWLDSKPGEMQLRIF